MNWDFAAILVLLLLVSGAIWLFDLLFLARNRPPKLEEEEDNIPFLVDLARSLFPVFLVVLVLRSFVFEPFKIPSGSMMPTLLVGDFILVNKFSYGIRLPVLNKKVIDIGDPERGDVVVFRYPEDPTIPYIKRVVGLPGDQIVYDVLDKVLYVNGEKIEQEFVSSYLATGSGSYMTGADHHIENLGEVKHDILVIPERFSGGEYQQMTLSEGQYFVLGDNRDNSKDSRYWGAVPEENLIGKAFFIWMNWDGGVSWKRLGSVIN